jgi:hypothetical protein
MPYTKKKQKCKQSDGDQGNYILSYTDKKGKKRQACHTSEKKMQGQIAAIETESARHEGITNKRGTLRLLIREILQSHTLEPVVGDYVENVNPGCKHFGSEGVVVNMKQLPQDMGTVACYKCTNSGENWSAGDILEKSLDQLAIR